METKNKINARSDSNKEKVVKEIKKINVIISGLTGNMATNVAEKVHMQPDMKLARMALTGEGMTLKVGNVIKLGGKEIVLIEPKAHKEALEMYIAEEGEVPIIVDFVAPPVKGGPSPAVGNAELYCSLKAPFVMGSTMAKEETAAIKQMVINSKNLAVLAPNMAPIIVIVQDMMEYAARKYPGILKDYLVELSESHQASKKDTSGTMRSILQSIQKLGPEVKESDIRMIRDPKVQEEELSVPKEYLGGHGHHWYNFTSLDGTVFLDISHRANGRDVYGLGTLAPIRFVHRKRQEGVTGAFTLIDVLSEGSQ